VDTILHDADHDPKRLLEILAATQDAYGYLPVAALKRISFGTGAWYAMVYGTATYYDHLRFEPQAPSDSAPSQRGVIEGDYLSGLDQAIAGASTPAGRVH
jgi:hypothetical protein